MSYLSEDQLEPKFTSSSMYVPRTDVVASTCSESQQVDSRERIQSTISNVYADLEKTDEEIQLMNQNLYQYIDKMITIQKGFEKPSSLCSQAATHEELIQRSVDASWDANVVPYPKSDDSCKCFRPFGDNSLAVTLGVNADNQILNAYERFTTSLHSDGIDIANSVPCSSAGYSVSLPNEIVCSVSHSTETKRPYSVDDGNRIESNEPGRNHSQEMSNFQIPGSLYPDYCVSTNSNRLNEMLDRNNAIIPSDAKVSMAETRSDRLSNENSRREEHGSSFRPYVRKDASVPLSSNAVYIDYPRDISHEFVAPEGNYSSYCAQNMSESRDESGDDDYEDDYPECDDYAERANRTDETQAVADHASDFAIMSLDECQVEVHQEQYYQNYYKMLRDRSRNIGDGHLHFLPDLKRAAGSSGDNLKQRDALQSKLGESSGLSDDSVKKRSRTDSKQPDTLQSEQGESSNFSEDSISKRARSSRVSFLDPKQDSICQNILKRYNQYKRNIVSEIPKVEDATVQSSVPNESSSTVSEHPQNQDTPETTSCETLTYGEYKKRLKNNAKSIASDRSNIPTDRPAVDSNVNAEKLHLRKEDSSRSEHSKRIPNLDRAESKYRDSKRVTDSLLQTGNQSSRTERDFGNRFKNKNASKDPRSNTTKTDSKYESSTAKPIKERNATDKNTSRWNPLTSRYGRKPGRDHSHATEEASFNPFSPFCPGERIERAKSLLNVTAPERDPSSTLAAIFEMRHKTKGKGKDSETKRFDANKARGSKKRRDMSEKDVNKHTKKDTKRKDVTVSEPVVSSTNDFVDSDRENVVESTSRERKNTISTDFDDSENCEAVTSSTHTSTKPSDQTVNVIDNDDSINAVEVSTVSNIANEIPESNLQIDNGQHEVGVSVSESVPQTLEPSSEKLRSEVNVDVPKQMPTGKLLQSNNTEHSAGIPVRDADPVNLGSSNEELKSVENENACLRKDLNIGNDNAIHTAKSTPVSASEVPNQRSEELKPKSEQDQNAALSCASESSKQAETMDTTDSGIEDIVNERKKGSCSASSNDRPEDTVAVANGSSNVDERVAEPQNADDSVTGGDVRDNISEDSNVADVCEPEKPTLILDIDIQRICKYRFCKLVLLDIFWKAKRDGKFKKSRLNRLTRKFMKKYNTKLNKAKSLMKKKKDSKETASSSLQGERNDSPCEEELPESTDPAKVDTDVDRGLRRSKCRKIKIFSESDEDEPAESKVEGTLKIDDEDSIQKSQVSARSPSEASCVMNKFDSLEGNEETPNASPACNSDIANPEKCENEPDISPACIEQVSVEKVNVVSEGPGALMDIEDLVDRDGEVPSTDKNLPETSNKMSAEEKEVQDGDVDVEPLSRIKIQRIRCSSATEEEHRYVCTEPKAPEDIVPRHAKSRDGVSKEKRKRHSLEKVSEDDEPKSKRRRKKKRTTRTDLCEDVSVESKLRPSDSVAQDSSDSDNDSAGNSRSRRTDKKKQTEGSPSKTVGRKKKKHKRDESGSLESTTSVYSIEKVEGGDLEDVDVSRPLVEERVGIHKTVLSDYNLSSPSATSLGSVEPIKSVDQENSVVSDDKSMVIVASNEAKSYDCKSVVYNFIYGFDKNLDSPYASDAAEGSVLTTHSDATTTCGVPLDDPASFGPASALPEIDNVMSEIDKSLLEIEKTPNTLIDDSSDSANEDVPFLKNLDSILTDLCEIGDDDDDRDNSPGRCRDEGSVIGGSTAVMGNPGSLDVKTVGLPSTEEKPDGTTCEVGAERDEVPSDPNSILDDHRTKVKTKAELKQTVYDSGLQATGTVPKNSGKSNGKGRKQKNEEVQPKISGPSSTMASRLDADVSSDTFVCMSCCKRYRTRGESSGDASQSVTLLCQACFIETYKKRFTKYKRKFKSTMKSIYTRRK